MKKSRITVSPPRKTDPEKVKRIIPIKNPPPPPPPPGGRGR